MNEIKEEQKTVIGKIIYLSEDGWGFLTTKEIPFTRIFFHWTSLAQETLHFTELEKGMEVEFIPIKTDEKGFRAIKIHVLEPDTMNEIKKKLE